MLWWNGTQKRIILPLIWKLKYILPYIWECHMDDSAKGRFGLILGRYLLTELILNPYYYEHVIKGGG